MKRVLSRITATTDVHSHLGDVTGMLSHLHAERSRSLVVDCGDFFEGTGYYRLGGGGVERSILIALYDIVAPGNHGWRHYFEPGLHELTVCANVVDDTSGKPLFRRLLLVQVGGRNVAVTAAIGPQAFDAIPAADRIGHRVTEPARALVELMLEHHHEVDTWVLLSHSGFEDDLQLAADCPFLDVVFSGHCHSERIAPEQVGDTLVVKGAELAAGCAVAEPSDDGWAVRVCSFPDVAELPAELEPIGRRIEELRCSLTDRLGRIPERWQHRVPDRDQLLAEVVDRLHRRLGSAVVLNRTALRSARLGDLLTVEDLLAIEPFGNQLVHIALPEACAADLPGLLARLTGRAGPLVVAPDPLPVDLCSVLTTNYLAEAIADGQACASGLPLCEVLREILADPTADGELT